MKLRVNIVLLCSLAWCFTAHASTPYIAIDSGNAEYAKSNYDKAITFYNSFISDGYESAQAYYNLGNCYYRKADYPHAILYYEKAKKLNPTDADIQFNLQLANLRTTDKINPDSSMFLTNWWNAFLDTFSEKGWAILSITFLVLGLLAAVGYMVSGSLFLRQLGFWGGMLLIALSLSTFLFSRAQYNAITDHDSAIVMTASITVKGAPADNATQLFLIHEGTKVWIIKSEGTWTEIKLANGSQGWLPSSDIATI